MELDAVPLGPERYRDWDETCLKSKEAWFWHTSMWLEYILAYCPSLESRSLSFMVCEQNRPVAVVPLVVEKHRHNGMIYKEFSYGGGCLPEPACVDGLSHRQKEELQRFIFHRVLSIGERHAVGRIRFRSNPFAFIGSDPSDTIPATIRYGFAQYIVPTQMIDLGKESPELLSEMRKGHRSDIRRAEKLLQARIVSRQQPDKELFAEYHRLHESAAGRKTRPPITFEMMYRWIEQGHGALFAACLKNKPVSFAYIVLYKGCAYYGSACNDPEAKGIPLAHFLQWRIINWLKEHGFRFYELGWQFYSPNHLVCASEKEITISRFKRGFGGKAVPMVISERFLSREAFLSAIEEAVSTLPGGSQGPGRLAASS